MSTMTCPFKPVRQREVAPHEHRYEVDILTDQDGVWVRDCACGHRERVRKNLHGAIVEELPIAVVPGGSIANVVFLKTDDGPFLDRWTAAEQAPVI